MDDPPIVIYDEEDVQESFELCSKSLIGAFLTDKPIHINSLQNALAGIWNAWLSLKRWERGSDVREINFSIVPLKVQIWGLPLHCPTTKMGYKIGHDEDGCTLQRNEMENNGETDASSLGTFFFSHWENKESPISNIESHVPTAVHPADTIIEFEAFQKEHVPLISTAEETNIGDQVMWTADNSSPIVENLLLDVIPPLLPQLPELGKDGILGTSALTKKYTIKLQ
ncbi:hypothetical protein SESBI_44026 [Sesbania bispinosa]|nr:hypothetical protein SESBI_44026 [Sesbania bispinosa]